MISVGVQFLIQVRASRPQMYISVSVGACGRHSCWRRDTLSHTRTSLRTVPCYLRAPLAGLE